MSETATETTPAAQPPAGAATTTGAPKLEDLLASLDEDVRKTVLGEVTKARSEAKNLRERVKAAEPKLQELATLQAASQTEAQRLTASEQAAAKAQRDALRFKVALEHGLTPDDLQFIHGDDEDQILASAEALRARLGQVQQSSSEPRAPRMDPSQGSSSGGAAAPDPGQQFAAFLKREMGR